MSIKAPKQLENVNRKTIRYIMFRMKDACERVFKEEMRVQFVLDSLPDFKKGIAKKIIAYYENKPNFTGWENFSTEWDVGCDDKIALMNWEDTTRLDKWWTFGISRFRVLKRPGLPTARNEKEGITRQFGGPMEFFVAIGYAKPKNGSYDLDVDKMLKDVNKRKEWATVVHTKHSLADLNEFENFYRSEDNILIAGGKK